MSTVPEPTAPTCPHCGALAANDHGSITTAMATSQFYDEDGRRHEHDPNVTNALYTCRNGHDFGVEYRPSCWCGWDR